MADYYPLIAKAVSGLEKSTGEARRALYDRARTALLAQLRGVEPALSEPDAAQSAGGCHGGRMTAIGTKTAQRRGHLKDLKAIA